MAEGHIPHDVAAVYGGPNAGAGRPSDQLSNVDALVQQVIAQGVMQGAAPMAEEIDALRKGTVKQIRLELDKGGEGRAEQAGSASTTS